MSKQKKVEDAREALGALRRAVLDLHEMMPESAWEALAVSRLMGAVATVADHLAVVEKDVNRAVLDLHEMMPESAWEALAVSRLMGAVATVADHLAVVEKDVKPEPRRVTLAINADVYVEWDRDEQRALGVEVVVAELEAPWAVWDPDGREVPHDDAQCEAWEKWTGAPVVDGPIVVK